MLPASETRAVWEFIRAMMRTAAHPYVGPKDFHGIVHAAVHETGHAIAAQTISGTADVVKFIALGGRGKRIGGITQPSELYNSLDVTAKVIVALGGVAADFSTGRDIPSLLKSGGGDEIAIRKLLQEAKASGMSREALPWLSAQEWEQGEISHTRFLDLAANVAAWLGHKQKEIMYHAE